ncbi:diguanylate cyclase domain-containing protein [Vibrio maerlii]|uniref:diguanylate cyclase domain-containing protein n=1 Tax=Vibrio maerlii TaxID=2231648 RepID=UPI000E3E7E54|nr:sensor domain-containing diguanylate cyclase [Vibrio maerlii]
MKSNALAATAVVFIGCLLVTLLCLRIVYQGMIKHNTKTLVNVAEVTVGSLRTRIHNDFDYIGSVANFYEATPEVNYVAFERFAENIAKRQSSIIAFEWMKKVELEELEQHTETMRQRFETYDIYTVPKDGEKTLGYLLENQEPIYVLTDIYPKSPINLSLLGFYSSRERFQRILKGTLETGDAHLSDPLRLLQDGFDADLSKEGLLVYHPVFNRERTALRGIVIGVIRMSLYFQHLVDTTEHEQDLMIRIRDTGFDSEDQAVMYQTENWRDDAALNISRVIDLPNRDWVVEFQYDEIITPNDRIILLYLMVAGLLLSSVLSWTIWALSQQKEVLKLKLVQRTHELKLLTVSDTLTGLLNRRAFNEDLKQRVTSKQPFSLVGIDVDYFKQVNDNYGHPTGDAFLIHIGKVLQAAFDESSVVYRLGGDEFCILNNITSESILESELQELQKLLEERPFSVDMKEIKISLSIGAAICQGESDEEIMHLVDQKMYQSKQAGRGCYVI